MKSRLNELHLIFLIVITIFASFKSCAQTNIDSLYKASQTLLENKKNQKVIENMTIAIQQNENCAKCYRLRALAYYNNGDKKLFSRDCKKAYEIDPNNLDK